MKIATRQRVLAEERMLELILKWVLQTYHQSSLTDRGRMTGKSEVISSFVGLVPVNALVLSSAPQAVKGKGAGTGILLLHLRLITSSKH